jgi:hypothetical protein
LAAPTLTSALNLATAMGSVVRSVSRANGIARQSDPFRLRHY